MKILFLKLPDPPGLFVNRDYCGGFGSAFHTSDDERRTTFPPIFDAYAASVLEKEGYNVSIIDAQAEKTFGAKLLERIEKVDPEVVVSRLNLPSFKNDLRTVDMVKARFPVSSMWGGGRYVRWNLKRRFQRAALTL